MSLKGLNGSAAGKQYAKRFFDYLEEGVSKGTLPFGADGKLIRSAMAQELGFNRDVFRTNPLIKAKLAEIEGAPRQRSGALDVESRAAGQILPAESQAQAHIKELQSKLLLVEEECRYLKEQLRRLGFSDLQQPASGRLPW